ncbi:MAG: hypothetical protein ACK4YK_09445, partial [Dolichospermum sp.]
ISHWGTSVIMDGRFDDDKSLVFTYGQRTATSLSSGQTKALMAIRVAPSADNGVAAAFDSIRTELIDFCYTQFKDFPALFTPCENTPNSIEEWEQYYMSGIKDFHTSGKVSSSLGIPMFLLTTQSKYTMPDGSDVKLPINNYSQALVEIESFVNKLR